MNQLKNSWEQMRTSFLNSEFFKDIVDGITNVVNKLKEFDAKDFAEFALLFSTLGKSVVSNFIKGMHDSSSAISTAFNGIIKKATSVFKDKKNKIDIGLQLKKQDVASLRHEIDVLEKERTDIKLGISNYEQVQEELLSILQLEEAVDKNGQIDIAFVQEEYTRRTGDAGTAAQLGELLHNTNEQDIKSRALSKAIGDEKALETISNQKGQIIGQALMAGITTAIIAVKDSDMDPAKAVQTIFGSVGASVAPMILNIGVTAGKAALATGSTLGAAIGSGITAGLAATGIGVAIAAALAVVTVKYKEYEKSVEKAQEARALNDEYDARRIRLKQLAEIQEKLNEELSEAQSLTKEEKDKLNELTEAEKSLEEYTNKFSLTNEEQKEFTALQNEIAAKMPEMIDYYNKQGDAILQMGNAWDTVIEKQKEAYNAANLEEKTKAFELAFTNYKKAQDELEKEKSFIENVKNYSSELQWLSTLSAERKLSEGNIESFAKAMSFEFGDRGISSLGERANESNRILRENRGWTGEDFSKITDAIRGILEKSEKFSEIADLQNNASFWNAIYDATNDEQREILQLIKDEAPKIAEEVSSSLVTGVKNAQKELDSALLENLQAYLQIDNGYQKASSNVQRVASQMALNRANQNGGIEGFENSSAWTYTIKDFGNNLETYNEQLMKAYEELLKDYSKGILENSINNPEQQSLIDAYYKLIEQDDANLKERMDWIKEHGNTILYEVAEGIRELEKENIDAYNKDFQAIADALGVTTTEGSNGLLTSTNKDLNKLANLSDVARTQLVHMFADAKFGAGELAEEILNIQDKYENLDLSTLLSIDWENMSIMDLESTKKAVIDTLSESMTSAEAEQAWEDFFNLAREFNLFDLITPDTNTDAIMEKATEDIAKRIEATNSVASAIKNQLTDGFISFTDSQTVEKACKDLGLDAADYINYGLNGERLTLDTDKLKEDIQAQAISAGDIVKQMQAEVDYNIELLNQQMAMLDGDQTKLKLLGLQNKQYAIQAKILQGMGLYEGVDPDSITKPIDDSIITKGKEALQDKIDEWTKWSNENLNSDSPFIQQLIGKYNAGELEILDIFDNIETEVAKTIEDNSEKIAAAKEKVIEANKKLAESEKELQKAIQGDPTRQSKLDGLYNYQTRLEQLNKQRDRSKNDLEDIQSDTDVRGTLQNLKSNVHAETVTKQAENEVYKQAIAKQNEILSKQLAERIKQINTERGVNMSTNVADYFTDTNGRFNVNFAALNAAGLNDEFKDYVEESIDNMNKYRIAIEDNTDAIKDRAKELRDFEKKAIDARVALEDKVVEVLRDKYEQEINNIKDRNDAIEDANNDYLDALEKAINKERSLRDRQREWDDLAKQEKKLSLMQRDTSGANRVETAKLEEDINKQREDLLDKSIDSIIEQLKEMYEEQQESREIEIEYMEAMLDNAALVKEANEIIKNWNGAEDAKQWFRDNIKEYSEWSQAKIQQEELGWEELFNNQTLYTETMTAKLGESIETTHDEIKKAVDSTSQNLIENTNRAFTAIGNKVDEIIGKAQDAVDDAKKAVAEAEKARDELTNSGSGGNKKNDRGSTKLAETTVGGTTAVATIGHMYGSTSSGLSGVISAITTSNNPVVNSKTGVSYGEENARAAANRTVANSNSLKQTVQTSQRNSVLELLGGTTNVKTAAGNLFQNVGNGVKKFSLPILSDGVIDSVIEELKQYNELSFGLKENTLYVSKIRSLLKNEVGKNAKIYAKGGLVPYTGPAWVDGTPSRPEAFLSADDTERIGQLTQLLENIPFFNSTIPSDNISTTNIGDTTIEVNITIENVSSDYDVDQAVERVKQDIVDAARYTGSNVILKQ